MQTKPRTWRYALSSQIMLAILTVFMFAAAALIVATPALVGGPASGFDYTIPIFAGVIACFGVFAFFGLLAVVRTRVSLDATTLSATVPGDHVAFLIPTFRAVRLPIAEIRSVERREEIFKQFWTTNLRDSLSVVTKAGERIGLVSATVGTIQFPLDEMADAIARAAGVEVTDDGTVRTKAPGLYGEASSSWTETPLDEKSANAARDRVLLGMQIAAGLILLGVVLRACT